MIDFIELNPSGLKSLEDTIEILKLQLARRTTVPGTLIETRSVLGVYVFSLIINPYVNGLTIVNVNTGACKHFEFNPDVDCNESKFIKDVYQIFTNVVSSFEYELKMFTDSAAVRLLQ